MDFLIGIIFQHGCRKDRISQRAYKEERNQVAAVSPALSNGYARRVLVRLLFILPEAQNKQGKGTTMSELRSVLSRDAPSTA